MFFVGPRDGHPARAGGTPTCSLGAAGFMAQRVRLLPQRTSCLSGFARCPDMPKCLVRRDRQGTGSCRNRRIDSHAFEGTPLAHSASSTCIQGSSRTAGPFHVVIARVWRWTCVAPSEVGDLTCRCPPVSYCRAQPHDNNFGASRTCADGARTS